MSCDHRPVTIRNERQMSGWPIPADQSRRGERHRDMVNMAQRLRSDQAVCGGQLLAHRRDCPERRTVAVIRWSDRWEAMDQVTRSGFHLRAGCPWQVRQVDLCIPGRCGGSEEMTDPRIRQGRGQLCCAS
jgi:hypothetical protein